MEGVPPIPRRVANAVCGLFERRGLGFEERRKRKLFAVLIVPGVGILLSFGVHHLLRREVLEGLLDLAAGIWLIASLVAFRFLEKGLIVYRLNTGVLALLFVFLAAKGGVHGNKLMWAFSFPLVAFYTLGKAEGLVWTAGVLALIAGVLHAPVGVFTHHEYPGELRIRFYVAFFLVASLTYIYESVRERSQKELERERNELEGEKAKLAELVSERKEVDEARGRLEERLARSEKMEALGLLAGGVAHDLNNVLVGVVGYPDALIDELPPGSPHIEPLTIIRDSGLKAAAIVQDLLALARRAITRHQVLDLDEVVAEYLATPEHASVMGFHPDVTLSVQLGPGPKRIQGSAVHLRKAILNLVSNAADALPGGGRVVIRTELRSSEAGRGATAEPVEAQRAVLVVEDNGIGIPSQDIAWWWTTCRSSARSHDGS